MRYNQPFSVADTNAAYVNGNPSAGVIGSIPPAEAIEYPQREIVAVIQAAGLDPDNNVLTQLRDAILALISGATTSVPDRALLHYGVASGTNDLTVSSTPAMASYLSGSTIIFVPANDNTGAATINVSGGGVKPLRRSDGVTALAAGDIRAGALAIAVYDGSVFRLVGLTAALPIVYVQDTGTADALSGSGSPSLASWREGQVVVVRKAGSANATATPTLNVDGRGAKTITLCDSTPVAAGDLVAGSQIILAYDGTKLRLLSMARSELASGIAAARSIFNVRRFTTTTRVSASAAATGEVVNVWSGASYAKKSSTSVLLVWPNFAAKMVGTPGTAYSAITYRMSVGPVDQDIPLVYGYNLYPSATSGVVAISGVPSGTQSWSLGFKRDDSFSWNTIFNPNGASDESGYPNPNTATMVFAEVEP